MNVRPLLLSLLVLAPPSAFADAVRVSLQPRAVLGKGLPALQVHIEEPIAGFEVKLQRSDGHPVKASGSGAPGVMRSVPLEQPEGRFHYEGELVVRFADAPEASMPLSFDAELLGPLKMTVVPEDVELEAHRLRFTLSRPASRAQVVVMMDTGQKAFDGEVRFQGEPAGKPLEVTWPAAEGRVLRISLKAYDTADFYTTLELLPWRVDIPHEEILFASGEASVPEPERAKLDASRALIADAVNRYGRLASMRLYILGHTDTVGSAESNRNLSMARAGNIAAYFRKRHLTLPIFFEGVGEQSPRVVTPDETPEAANRRVEYILALEPPALPASSFPLQWRKL